MHFLLGFWLFGRAEKPNLTSVSSLPFFILAAAIIFFISWVLGAFRLPRQVVPPLVLLTTGILLTCIQEGFFPLTTTSNPVWRIVLLFMVASGFVWLMAINVQSMLQRFKLQQRLVDQDSLTGLLNRAGTQRILKQLTPQQNAVMVMMDLNDLKAVNDLGGHNAGDQHIRSVAQAITEVLPQGAVASRWGGDEFLVLLPHSSVAEANNFAQQVIDHAPKIRLTLPALAFGSAQVHSYEDVQRALAVADQRMYEDKERVKHTHIGTLERHVPSAEEIMRLIEGIDNTADLLHYGFDNLRLILGFDASAYYEKRDGWLEAVYISSDDEQRDVPLHSLKRELSSGLMGQAILTNRTVGTADYPSEMKALPGWKDSGLRSFLVTPVRDAGMIVGTLALMSYHNWRPITPQARRLLEAVALRLGYILERERVLKQVELTLDGGLMALGLALEARDVESFGHTQRVVTYAEALGKALNLPSAARIELKQGACLHDLGKLMVPDSLLGKPGRLTAEEFKTMQQHVSQGFALASRIPDLSQGALDVILYHHEDWDGKGYPSGRSGLQIPLLARIFTVCDVYEALISVRPYKPAWPPSVALSEIEAQAGKKFDPGIVTVFLQMMQHHQPAGIDEEADPLRLP
ncbi:hypothetical protein GCM10022631_25210 [Deinococcus rubellus]|uniref:Diguanylate cyclase n=1 Tax=Deinococcus rubellus TaxID=1889240 RepID=A0ABY5YKQ5_9DEIO|nr:HD domain-containing phosphohydrolase [Deinococcus rubellus]UWX65687.1 diguanylate cyclase [Deinococcus rubellus]